MWKRRRPIKSATVWTHRWTALVLGLLLLVVCTSGVPLLWQEEIIHAQHPEAYRAAGPAKMSFDEVAAVVARHDPDFKLGLVPLLLAVTGLSTWLWTRGVRKRRRRREAADATAGA